MNTNISETIYVLVTCDQVLDPPMFLQRHQSQYTQSGLVVHIFKLISLLLTYLATFLASII